MKAFGTFLAILFNYYRELDAKASRLGLAGRMLRGYIETKGEMETRKARNRMGLRV